MKVDFLRGSAEVNEVAVDLFGGDERWIDRSIPLEWLGETIAAEDRSFVRGRIRAVTPQAPSFVAEHRTSSRVLPTRWVLSRGQVYFDQTGTRVGAVAVVIDITEVKADGGAYVRALPHNDADQLNALANHLIAARTLIDDLDLAALRPSADKLLMKIGRLLGARLRAASFIKMH